MGTSVILGGVLSSLLAVGLVEFYSMMKKYFWKRSLKRVLPHRNGKATIVIPSIPAGPPNEAPLLSRDDALALMYLLEALRAIDVEAVFYASEDNMGRSHAGGLICIGGPQTNSITKMIMDDHVRGFELRLAADSTDEIKIHKCGDRRIHASSTESFWTLTWLPGETVGMEDNTLLIWGHYGSDTVAAAYYLISHFRQLSRLITKRRRFFLVGTRSPRLGYMSAPHSPEDLSHRALLSR